MRTCLYCRAQLTDENTGHSCHNCWEIESRVKSMSPQVLALILERNVEPDNYRILMAHLPREITRMKDFC